MDLFALFVETVFNSDVGSEKTKSGTESDAFVYLIGRTSIRNCNKGPALKISHQPSGQGLYEGAAIQLVLVLFTSESHLSSD